MERLKVLRIQKGLTQKQLAELLGIDRTSIVKYETGKNGPTSEILERLADIFNVSVDYLLGRSESSAYISPPQKGVKIPVLGVIPAGIPIEAIEDIVDWEEVPIDWTKGGKEYFALQVKGDSMYPEYLPDDVVIVQKTPTCESGDDCVVYVNGYDATLKRVIKNPDNSITIKPLNANYPPRTFSEAEIAKLPVTIGGVVVELRRKKKG